MLPVFNNAVSALCYTFVGEVCLEGREPESGPLCCNSVVRFVDGQLAGMPDFFRPAAMALTIVFSAQCVLVHGRLFHRLDRQKRWRHVLGWKQSRLGFRRDFVRLYESLVILAWNSPEL